MTASPYKKLPGRGWTWSGPSRVWLGEDHVLLVLNRTFFESYRRFFLNDIQAVIVQRTHTGKTWTGVWATAFIFFSLIALAVDDRIAALVLAGLGVPFFVALIINIFLGPTCACYIRTAVQTERVPAISRLRTARKFIARVEPLITTAQGSLSPEQFATEVALTQSAAAASENAPPVLGS